MKKFSLKDYRTQQLVFSGITLLLAVAALLSPFKNESLPERLGGLLIWTAVLVFIQSFSRALDKDRHSGRISSLLTLLMGVLLVNRVSFVLNALIFFFSALLIIDALRQLLMMRKHRRDKPVFRRSLAIFGGDVLVLLALLLLQRKGVHAALVVSSALRMVGAAFEMLTIPVGTMSAVGEDVVGSLQLPDRQEIRDIAKRIETEEAFRAPIDRGWIISFLVILFCIHLGRIGFDRSPTGLLSPFVSLVGDMVVALIIAFFIIAPLKGAFHGATAPVVRSIWNWVLAVPPDQRKKWYSLRGLMQTWLEYRLRISIRARRSGYSFPTAIRSGLQTGLPFAALLAAIVPVFGMSWYFDTENWASGIWDRWAAERTDKWRQAMVEAVEPMPNGKSFTLRPPGVTDTGAFSFVILGDPGEGDASQYVLHDQIVKTTANPDVKFMVISSDVVYPDGAMKDYEKKFWLPMKGVTKPVYAIPGNHDWYDALEGFVATFYTPDAARKAMSARKESDLNLTTTGTHNIEKQIREAARLREAYRVPTGYQTAPFFQVQTKHFAFITVETGVLRRIDTVQMAWLKQALEASKGKFIFVLLGHPFYAIGEYQGSMNPDFQRLHELLREYGAKVIMAGDTHDLEYYLEPAKGKHKQIHHFVNGGGGAYLSIGASLKPPGEMPEKIWAHYPAKEPLVRKIESNNGPLKKPAWNWTLKYNGWPYSAEWLSAAFDYNKAPFFQSYMEIRVEPKQNRVRLLAYGVHGPLTWGDMEMSGGVKPAGAKDSDPAEWVISMKH